MTHVGGLAVGFAVVFTVLIPVTTRLNRRYPGRTRWTDWALGVAITGLWTVAVITFSEAWWPEAPTFVDAAVSGVGVAPIVFVPDIVAALRRRRHPGPVRVLPERLAAVRRSIAPVAFVPDVHRHFAEPEARARYVVAAYRRGVIPAESVPGLAADLAHLLPDGVPAWAELAAHDGGTGLGGVVDRAAHELGYAPSPEQERADAVERLVYAALSSTDPMVRLATVELLAPGEGLGLPRVSNPPATMSVTRATIEGYFDGAHGVALDEGVDRHFADPTVRARRMIAAYRRHEIPSRDVGTTAAELVADLPGAGPAWTELAMAGPTAWRSDLDGLVDRAAAEIGHTDADEPEILIEYDLYCGLVDGDVLDRSRLIWIRDERSPFAVPFILAGHLGDIGIATFFTDGAEHLNGKYSTPDVVGLPRNP
ncbi:hypothetical protein [Tsukamurella pseudospumae]|nr:hypothetical protein [Tsukamurella pseudospumae]KXO95911.1 hypothetical protein AXK61_04470 [Tsukamurella pseudospumae]